MKTNRLNSCIQTSDVSFQGKTLQTGHLYWLRPINTNYACRQYTFQKTVIFIKLSWWVTFYCNKKHDSAASKQIRMRIGKVWKRTAKKCISTLWHQNSDMVGSKCLAKQSHFRSHKPMQQLIELNNKLITKKGHHTFSDHLSKTQKSKRN